MGWNGVPEQILNVVTKSNGVKEYQVSDHLASLRVAVESGTTRTVDYTPWGSALAGDPVTGERQTFNGQERDRENGLFDLSDRNLDPLTGRFLKCDRLLDQEPALTPYHYAANNPMRLTDPTGFQASPIQLNQDNVASVASGIIQGIAVRAGYTSTIAAVVRVEYVTKVAVLGKKETAARTAVKAATRAKTPPEYLAIAEAMRPSSGESSRTGGTANKSNATVNSAMEHAGLGGKILLGLGIAMSVHNIAKADNKVNAAIHETGGWAGTLAVGEIGATLGMRFGPVGAIVGGLVGGAIGQFVGGEAAEKYLNAAALYSCPPVP